MWCVKCHYGHKDYNFKVCGHCHSTEMTSENPFRKDIKKKFKNTKAEARKAKKAEETMHLEIEDRVKGHLKSRNYEDLL